MKRTLTAGVAAALLAIVTSMTPAAHAHPNYHYRGGCTYFTIRSGVDSWTGEASAVLTATTTDTDPDPAVNNSIPVNEQVSFRCTLWRNGTTNLGTVLSGSGQTVASDTDPTFSFRALDVDEIWLCSEVTIGSGPGAEVHADASTFNTTDGHCTEGARTLVFRHDP